MKNKQSIRDSGRRLLACSQIETQSVSVVSIIIGALEGLTSEFIVNARSTWPRHAP